MTAEITLGGALRDEEAEEISAAELETERQQKRASEAREEAHLCNKCLHAPVCAIASAIRQLGGDGEVVLSVCGAFATLGIEIEPESAK